MAEIKFDIYAYDQAMMNFFEQVMEGFLSEDPFLGKIPRSSSSHSGPIRNVRGPSPLDQKSCPIEITTSLKVEGIRQTNFEEFTVFLYEFAHSHQESLGRQFFQGLEEITTATGNTVNAAGNPFSWEYFNTLIEMMPIEFDENDQPKLPTMIANPKALEKIKGIKATPEQEVRFSEIIERKRVEFHAQARTRRLSK